MRNCVKTDCENNLDFTCMIIKHPHPEITDMFKPMKCKEHKKKVKI